MPLNECTAYFTTELALRRWVLVEELKIPKFDTSAIVKEAKYIQHQ